ncbi:putative GTP pyrophosphokinase [Lentzea atacamensis]|uniref:GTP pyrophosphokinase n=1 Tax=Lentzea atacamensis TaxID=531938 RepID=A0A316HYN5_9PSEU|nr:GTP pyrophosphokinase family protein [Lentzea atacamensis]PWK86279.1 putative GTP pyrophosphokinase [Lentzea atacamensis]RAS65787.1 putative GTP pyrophosphokinase [Lentzea atacamensis]
MTDLADDLSLLRDLERRLLVYKFAIEELMTKLRILSEEFDSVHRHDPIEHITNRVKKPEGILEKLRRKGLPLDVDAIGEVLDDIAGVRVICPFVSDVYRVSAMLARQHDVEILRTKDYIAVPKPNGYRSLHLIVRIPVFLSDRVEHVKVEVQLRTIAMDFWATLEHKLFYKYDDSPPADFVDELMSSAMIAAQLDERMESLHRRIHQDEARQP